MWKRIMIFWKHKKNMNTPGSTSHLLMEPMRRGELGSFDGERDGVEMRRRAQGEASHYRLPRYQRVNPKHKLD